MSRSIAVVAVTAVAVLVWLVSPGPTVADSFDDACASPTQTIAADSSTAISLTPTSVVLISGGTFSGGLDAFPSGAVLCVAAGATAQPAYMNNAAGAIYGRGTIRLPATAVNGGFRLENYGLADFPQSFNTNGVAELINHVGGTWTMSQGFSTSSHLVNDGTATLSGGLNQNGGTVENTGVLTIAGSSNLGGTVSNTGRFSGCAIVPTS